MFRYLKCPGCAKNFIFDKADEGSELECPYCDQVCQAEPSAIGKDTVIGHHYLLKHLVETTDLGHTYIAQNLKTDTVCQVCLFVSDFTDSISDVNEFRYFLTAASKICTPAHIQISDSGVDEQICFIVWESRDTESLSSVVDRTGGLRPLRAAQFCKEIAQSLANAWRVSSFPHLNLSPDAIYIDTEGKLRLHHFGITYFLFQDPKFLEADFPLLSPKFVSPALALGQEDVDYHSDIYSLGAVFYYMIIGAPPFEEFDEPQDILNAQLLLSEEEMEKTGPSMAALIQRLMSKTPEDEFSDWSQVIDAFDDAIAQESNLAAQEEQAQGVRAKLPDHLAITFDDNGQPIFRQQQHQDKAVLPPRAPRKTGRFTVADSIEKLATYPKQRVSNVPADKLYKTKSKRESGRTTFRRTAKRDLSKRAMESRIIATQNIRRQPPPKKSSSAALLWTVIILAGLVVGLLTALVVKPFAKKEEAPKPVRQVAKTPEAPLPEPKMEEAPANTIIPAPSPTPAPAPPSPPSLLDRQKAMAAVEDTAKVPIQDPTAIVGIEDLPRQENLAAMWVAAEELGPVEQENFDRIVLAYRKIAQEAMLLREPEWQQRAENKVAALEAQRETEVDAAKKRFLAKMKLLMDEGNFAAARDLCDDPQDPWAPAFGHERLVWRKRILEKIEGKAGALGGQLEEVERLVAEAVAGAKTAEASQLLDQVATVAEKMYGEEVATFKTMLAACTPEVLGEDINNGLRQALNQLAEYELADGSIVALQIVGKKGENILAIQHLGDAKLKKAIPVSQLSVRHRLGYIKSEDKNTEALKKAVYAQSQHDFAMAQEALAGYDGLLADQLKLQFPKFAAAFSEETARKLLSDSLALLGLDINDGARELIGKVSKIEMAPADATIIADKLAALKADFADTNTYSENKILIGTFHLQATRFERPDDNAAPRTPHAKREVSVSTVGGEDKPPLDEAIHRLRPGQTLRLDPGTYSLKIKILQPEVTLEGRKGVIIKEDLVVYKEGVTLKNIRFEDASIRVVSGVNGINITNCILDRGKIEFGGGHRGANLMNCRMNGLSVRDTTDLYMNHCTVLSPVKGADKNGNQGDASALTGDFEGKIYNSIIYSPTGVAMSLTDAKRSRTSFHSSLIHGGTGLALVRSSRLLMAIQDEKDFSRKVGRCIKVLVSEPEFVNADEGIYKLFINSPGAKAARDGFDMGIVTDDDNWPMSLE